MGTTGSGPAPSRGHRTRDGKWERCRFPRTNSGSCGRSRRTCRPPTPSWCSRSPTRTLYRHSARVIKWAVVGFIAGLLLMVFTFTTTLILGVVGFLVMLGCALAIEHNVRKLGRAGMESLTGSMRNGALKNMLGNAGNRWRERFGRDDPPS